MTAEQILESQAKLPCPHNCPKCRDRKTFVNKIDRVETCKEC